jgi:hypothetical protein
MDFELRRTKRNRAGTDQNDLPAVAHQIADTCSQRRNQLLVELLLSVANHRSANFYHDTAGAAQERSRIGYSFRIGWGHGHVIWLKLILHFSASVSKMVKQDGQARWPGKSLPAKKNPAARQRGYVCYCPKGSLNCIRPLQLPLNTRECGAKPRHGRVDVTMIELTIAENTT